MYGLKLVLGVGRASLYLKHQAFLTQRYTVGLNFLGIHSHAMLCFVVGGHLYNHVFIRVENKVVACGIKTLHSIKPTG